MNQVVRFPGSTPPQPMSVLEADARLFQSGELAYDGDSVFTWTADHPLTGAVAELVFNNLRDATGEDVLRRSSQARDTALQLRKQAVAFRQNAIALLAADASRLPSSDGPGLGGKECKELLASASLLTGPAGLSSIEARQQTTTTMQRVAAAFSSAATACEAWASRLTELRQERDGERLAGRANGHG